MSPMEINLMIAGATLPVGSGVQAATAFRMLKPYHAIIPISGYPVSQWSEGDTGHPAGSVGSSFRSYRSPSAPRHFGAESRN